MLRLAVVHCQDGPERGPGLDDDIQSPGIEDGAHYTGPQINPDDRPYGGGGEPRIYDVPGRGSDIPPRMLRRRRKKPASVLDGTKVVAIDLDGTVTADPVFFVRLISDLKSRGIESYLVTGRPKSDRAEVERYCSMRGLRFAGKYLYPLQYRMDWIGRDALLEIRIGTWKAKVLRELKADVMIDDNGVFIDQIVRELPAITILKPIGGAGS